MRGKATHLNSVAFDIGITPAYAGKSFFGFGAGFFKWDHPRLCGEKPTPS